MCPIKLKDEKEAIMKASTSTLTPVPYLESPDWSVRGALAGWSTWRSAQGGGRETAARPRGTATAETWTGTSAAETARTRRTSPSAETRSSSWRTWGRTGPCWGRGARPPASCAARAARATATCRCSTWATAASAGRAWSGCAPQQPPCLGFRASNEGSRRFYNH